jgi:eukaryotic-like serine/threonine-protein kinase
MSYQIGDRVGDYQIVDVLGAGGMGKVYKVRNVISDRMEAMKVLLPNLESDPALADRFMREIKVQASLQHQHIAGLHTALRINNQLIMLLEFVEGRTIEAELRNGALPNAKAVDYIKQVLSALSYAHSRGVVHRDIKPANMMLTPGGVVKLMDFGIARMAADQRLTQTGSTVGSLFYMSPEQIQGAENLDGRSDLYSVGISLYEMVTNRRPFQGDSDYSIMAAHLNSVPVPPIQHDPSLPPALSEIILMSIAKDPAQRFQTADAFRAALNSVSLNAAAAAVGMKSAAGSATKIGGAHLPAVPSPKTPPPPIPFGDPNAIPPRSLSPNIKPGNSKRGLYMAIGSVVTIGVLAFAALQAPKFFRPSSAASEEQQRTPAAAQQPVSPTVAAAPAELTPVPAASEPVAAPAPAAAKTPQVTEAKPAPQQRSQPTPAQTQSSHIPAAQPVQTAQAITPQAPVQQPPAVVAPPSAPAVSAQEIEDLRERLMLLGTRANSAKASLNSMRKQMGGLNLNAEFTNREQRMELFLDQAEAALKGNDAARAKKNLENADRVIDELEKKLGR